VHLGKAGEKASLGRLLQADSRHVAAQPHSDPGGSFPVFESLMSAPLGEALYGRIWVTPEEYRCLPPFPTCGRPLKGSRGSRLGDGIARPGSPLDLAPMMDGIKPWGEC
jgi:hypothetical protein